MTEQTKCRRCSECVGMSHHWIEDCLEPPDGEEFDFDPGDYVCKHCGRRGAECELCDGEGYSDDTTKDVRLCPLCKGEGVRALDLTSAISKARGA